MLEGKEKDYIGDHIKKIRTHLVGCVFVPYQCLPSSPEPLPYQYWCGVCPGLYALRLCELFEDRKCAP